MNVKDEWPDRGSDFAQFIMWKLIIAAGIFFVVVCFGSLVVLITDLFLQSSGIK